MADDKEIQKIVISVDHQGDCAIHSPKGMPIDEILEVLTAALEAATAKAEKLEQSKNKDVEQDLIESLKTKDLAN